MAINHLDITLIVGNKADPNLTAEHGLAMWINTPNGTAGMQQHF